MKDAVTFLAADIVTVHEVFNPAPIQSPPHPVKVWPEVGDA